MNKKLLCLGMLASIHALQAVKDDSITSDSPMPLVQIHTLAPLILFSNLVPKDLIEALYEEDFKKGHISPATHNALHTFFNALYTQLEQMDDAQGLDYIKLDYKTKTTMLKTETNSFLQDLYRLQKNILSALITAAEEYDDVNVHLARMHSTLDLDKLDY